MVKYLSNIRKTTPKLSLCLFSPGRPTSSTRRRTSSSSSMPKSSTRRFFTTETLGGTRRETNQCFLLFQKCSQKLSLSTRSTRTRGTGTAGKPLTRSPPGPS
eukprot:6887511-Pyramimonas_sp.AAC.1